MSDKDTLQAIPIDDELTIEDIEEASGGVRHIHRLQHPDGAEKLKGKTKVPTPSSLEQVPSPCPWKPKR